MVPPTTSFPYALVKRKGWDGTAGFNVLLSAISRGCFGSDSIRSVLVIQRGVIRIIIMMDWWMDNWMNGVMDGWSPSILAKVTPKPIKNIRNAFSRINFSFFLDVYFVYREGVEHRHNMSLVRLTRLTHCPLFE